MTTCPICQSFTFHNSLFYTDKCTNCDWEDNNGYERKFIKREMIEEIQIVQKHSNNFSADQNIINTIPVKEIPIGRIFLNFQQNVTSMIRFLFFQISVDHLSSIEVNGKF